MTEMLLLGAGASVNAGVPDARGMSEKMLSHFSRSPALRKHNDILNFVVGGLLFQAGCRGNNPLSAGVNIEDLFNAVRLLADRENLEAAPFIGSWHELVEQFDRHEVPHLDRLHRAIYESVAKQLTNAFSDEPSRHDSQKIDAKMASSLRNAFDALRRGGGTYYSSFDSVGDAVANYLKSATGNWRRRLAQIPNSYDFRREFQRALDSTRLSSGGRVFASVNEEMIRALVELIWIGDPEKVKYLSPILRLAKAQSRLVVATLNYDNAIELLVATYGGDTACNTGIDAWPVTGAFEPAADGIHLLKLHGSIDWAYATGPSDDDRIPQTVVQHISPGDMQQEGYHPAIIFGQRNKLTADGPFLDILRGFRSQLSVASRLTIIGYSFRDDHINTLLSQWLNRSKLNRLRIISRDFAGSGVPYADQLRRHVPSRLEIIEEWAPDGLEKAFPLQ